ncbi:hypothetical protein [Mycolicibacterium sp.]|uniref:hypothetical protein n=1 Tax=Mycolicibacterium sp. TaxID=2320850 RepID=UPI0037CA3CD4
MERAAAGVLAATVLIPCSSSLLSVYPPSMCIDGAGSVAAVLEIDMRRSAANVAVCDLLLALCIDLPYRQTYSMSRPMATVLQVSAYAAPA